MVSYQIHSAEDVFRYCCRCYITVRIVHVTYVGYIRDVGDISNISYVDHAQLVAPEVIPGEKKARLGPRKPAHQSHPDPDVETRPPGTQRKLEHKPVP
jgi:hypothetical protein